MKILKVLGVVAIVLSLTACGDEKQAGPAKVVKPEASEVTVDTEKEESNVDTSVFQYAKDVEVTDARDIEKHINLVVRMDPEMGSGLAVQHVVKQTYDFLQQSDVEGAETITIGIMQDDFRIAQYTVDTTKFTAGEDEIASVIEASEIQKMDEAAKEYGATTGKW